MKARAFTSEAYQARLLVLSTIGDWMENHTDEQLLDEVARRSGGTDADVEATRLLIVDAWDSFRRAIQDELHEEHRERKREESKPSPLRDNLHPAVSSKCEECARLQAAAENLGRMELREGPPDVGAWIGSVLCDQCGRGRRVVVLREDEAPPVPRVRWVPTEESCPACGEEGRVLTSAPQPEDGWAAGDGDPAVCPSCELRGAVSIDEDAGEAWVSWEEPDEPDTSEAFDRACSSPPLDRDRKPE